MENKQIKEDSKKILDLMRVASKEEKATVIIDNLACKTFLQYIDQLENKVKELECDNHNKENKIIEQEKFLQMSAEVIKNSLLKQVIRNKIEELNKKIEKYREYTEQGIETDVEWIDNVADRQTVKVLQELLEENMKGIKQE